MDIQLNVKECEQTLFLDHEGQHTEHQEPHGCHEDFSGFFTQFGFIQKLILL